MDPLAKTQLYRRGDTLADGSMVVAIAKAHVLLVKAGERRVLILGPKARLAPVSPVPELAVESSLPAEPQTPIAGLEKVRDGIYRLRREAVMARLDRSDDLFSDTTASLVFGQAGEVTGLRLRLEDPASLFARLGFLDGDVLVRVGSLVIDSPDRLDGLVALIESAREIEVQLLRAGRTQLIRFWLDDR
jgi:type II secretory pathway component PulC